MLPLWFLYIAAAMRIGGGLAYLTATLRGKAKPNPVSWMLWGALPIIAFSAEISAGVGHEAIITLALGVSPILVFVTTMLKNPRSFELKGLNLACVIIALTGIAAWTVTKTPEFAIGLMILADFASAVPTIRKTWRQPKSEFSPTYLISAVSMVIALLTITDWRFAAVAYPVYTLGINLLIFTLARRSPRRKKRKRR